MAKFPLLDFSLFRLYDFSTGNITGFLMKLAEGGPLFLLPFYFVCIHKLSIQTTAMLMIVITITVTMYGIFYGKISKKFTPLFLMIFSQVCLIISFAGLYTFIYPVTILIPALLMFFRGTGIGLFYPPNRNQVIASVPAGKEGQGSGYLRFIEQLGYILSIAIFETIFSEIIPEGEESLITISDKIPFSQLVSAFQVVFFIVAGVSVGIIALIIVFKRFKHKPFHDDPV